MDDLGEVKGNVEDGSFDESIDKALISKDEKHYIKEEFKQNDLVELKHQIKGIVKFCEEVKNGVEATLSIKLDSDQLVVNGVANSNGRLIRYILINNVSAITTDKENIFDLKLTAMLVKAAEIKTSLEPPNIDMNKFGKFENYRYGLVYMFNSANEKLQEQIIIIELKNVTITNDELNKIKQLNINNKELLLA